MNNNKKTTKKRRTTKIEKLLMVIMLSMTVATPLAALTISTVNLIYMRDISRIENEINDVKQEVTELEVKKQEQLSWDEVKTYAAAGGLDQNEERVKRV